jgi:hypothetical protein
MTVLEELGIAIFSGVIIGGITAWITVRFSLGKFFSERWWERKAESYTELVEALFNIQNNLKVILVAVEEGQQYDDSEYDRLAKLSSQSYDRLYRASAIGAFTISEDVAISLDTLLTEMKKTRDEWDDIGPQTWWENRYGWFERRLDLVSSAIGEIRNLAKLDLKVD